MSSPALSLLAGAVEILQTPDGGGKVILSHSLAAAWRSGALPVGEPVAPPNRPARPERPALLMPRDMPKRRAKGSPASKIALLHALAHIELNAIDLVWDLIARFPGLGPGYYDDWIKVADEEAKHFDLLAGRLASLGAAYGDLPAHDGLWQSADMTAHDLLARLALVPMVLEARGLDVTPTLIASLEQTSDTDSADILRVVYRDEIGHVEIGRVWFERLCAQESLDPLPTWQRLVRQYFRGALKRPFNATGRDEAGLARHYYEPLADEAAPSPS